MCNGASCAWIPISGQACAFDASCSTYSYGGYGSEGTCQNGFCYSPMGTTASCNDFDPCTSGDMCTQFGCKGQPIQCNSTDPCQEPVGTCIPEPAKARRPGTGGAGYECQFTQKPIGTPCGSDDLCFTNFVCTECGDCEGTPKCNNPPACYVLPGNCNPQDGACTYTFDSVYGTPCDDGLSCTTDVCDDKLLACTSTLDEGYCLIGGVCVSAGDFHPTNKCLVCDPLSSTTDWTPLPTGTSCSDGNACNGDEVCQTSDPDAGAVTSTCVAGTPILCNSPPPCYTGPGQCDTVTGDCSYNAVAIGTPCPDSDLCNGTETCQPSELNRIAGGGVPTTLVCTPGTPVTCNNPPTCKTAGSCNSATGMCDYPNAMNGTSCSDGDACNGAEVCQNGTCTGGTAILCNNPPVCYTGPGQCDSETGECTYNEVEIGTPCPDSNPCNGVETCQRQVVENERRAISEPPPPLVCSAGTPVTCNNPPLCHTAQGAQCDPMTGLCNYPNAMNGTPCTDPGICSDEATCQNGTCTASGSLNCNDNNPCTADTCGEEGCSHSNVPDGTPCSNGNACDGEETCQSGVCTSGAAVVCNNPPTCHTSMNATCNPADGQCSYPPVMDGTSCADNDLCNGNETCVAGACTAGTAIVCNSPDTCKTDVNAQCDPSTGQCSYPNAPNGTSCSNGNACDGAETCQNGVCSAGTAVVCNNPPPCHTATGATCNPSNGQCSYPSLADGTSCADNDLCNGNETCVAGQCTAGTPVLCNRPPVCRTSNGATCDPATGQCTYPLAANGTSCSDGNACNGAETCQAGACVAGTPKVCNAPPSCHSAEGAICDPQTGQCGYPVQPNGTSCSDGNPCNGLETCQSGVCTAGVSVVCAQPPPCRTAEGATCDPQTGLCDYPMAVNGTSCSDGNACNGLETCVDGNCVAGTPIECRQPPVCRSAAGVCNPQSSRCEYPALPNGSSCSDGNPCNGVETCQQGVCVAGTPVACTTPPVCHTATGATCDPQTGGCVYPAATNGTPCPDNDACNGAETCQSGVCTAGAPLNCDDGNPCTVDSCQPGSGCTHTAASNGSECGSDGRTCQQGQCAARQPNYATTGTSCFSCGAGGDSSRPGGAPLLLLVLLLAAWRWRGRRRARSTGKVLRA